VTIVLATFINLINYSHRSFGAEATVCAFEKISSRSGARSILQAVLVIKMLQISKSLVH